MMILHFHKYHGTGNDFILIDNRAGDIVLSRLEVATLCHRRFGIGADGLMLLETAPDADFRMVYYNSDGGESTMCGNGGRCIAAFAKHLGIIQDKASFTAIDGRHEAVISSENKVWLDMINVSAVEHYPTHSLLNTGSPHYVLWVADAMNAPVVQEGRRIRSSPPFAPAGINVNFVQRQGERHLIVRTYERGVEDETMSCGTGVTAAAIAASGDATGHFEYNIQTPGGTLNVAFLKTAPDSATNVVLSGPASFVFEGTIMLPGNS